MSLYIKNINCGDVLCCKKKPENAYIVVGFDDKHIHLAAIFYIEDGWNDAVAMYGCGLKVDGLYLNAIDDISSEYKRVGNIYKWREIFKKQIEEIVNKPRRFCNKCIHRKCKNCRIMDAIKKQEGRA